MIAIRLIFNSTFLFLIINIINRSLGSPLFLIIADIVLQDLETQALSNLSFIPAFYFRYVYFRYDIVLAALITFHNKLLDIINSFPILLWVPRLKMVVILSIFLIFLIIIKSESFLIFDIGNLRSQVVFLISILVNFSVMKKAWFWVYTIFILLSRPKFHNDNLEFIVNTLLDNG